MRCNLKEERMGWNGWMNVNVDVDVRCGEMIKLGLGD